MVSMQRGEVWWINLDPTVGSEIKKTRPCVILTVNPLNRARRTVVVVPLSTAATPRAPIVVEMSSVGERCVAVCDQIRTIDKQRLQQQKGALNAADLKTLEESVRQVLGL